MSFEHLERAGFTVGGFIDYELTSYANGTLILQDKRAQIEGFAGGGFRGHVLLLDNESVLKTAVPDPLKEALRQLIGKVPFRDS